MDFRVRIEQFRSFCKRRALSLVALGLLLLFLQDIFGTHGLLAMRRSQRKMGEVRAETRKLNQENQRLENRVKALKTNPGAIEQIAREQMGLARPGELIFKLPAKPASSTNQNPPSSSPQKK